MPVAFLLAKSEKIFKSKYGGKKAVNLEKRVFIVSESASSSILFKKTGQLTCCSFAENGVLILKKVSLLKKVKKVLFVVIFKKEIWGQERLRHTWVNTWSCVPIVRRSWFVWLKSYSLYSAKSGRIVSLLITVILLYLSFLLFLSTCRVKCLSLPYQSSVFKIDLVKNDWQVDDLVKIEVTKVSDLVNLPKNHQGKQHRYM